MSLPGQSMNRLRVVRGQTKVLKVTVKTKEGRPASLADATIYFTARKDASSAVAICVTNDSGVVITDAANGEATITLSSSDTDIEKGTYRYDVWVEFSGDPPIRHPVVTFAELCIEERIGVFGCS